MAQHLYLVGTGEKFGSSKYSAFPISESAKEYADGFEKKVGGMRDEAKAALRALEPYKGGKGHDLWRLHALNNIDKHRLLITVGSRFRSLDIGALARPFAGEFFGEPLPPHALSLFIREAAPLPPLKIGEELFIDAPDAKENKEMQFRFDISLNEHGISEGEPLLEVIQRLTELVSNTTLLFKSLLS